jgi:hypothetical protein
MYSDDMVFSSASESVAPLLSLHLLQVCSAWTPTHNHHNIKKEFSLKNTITRHSSAGFSGRVGPCADNIKKTQTLTG